VFSKYFECGYVPIPIHHKGKNPAIKTDWTRWCRERPPESLIEEWDSDYAKRGWNIGVTCGPASGIIVVDIDTDDPKVLDLCPPSPVRRRGQKGEARFFRYSPEIQSQSFPYLDILSNGRQVLVPPSIHPKTEKPYIWLTPDTIETIRPEDLPELDTSFISKLMPQLRSVRTKGEGRNNRLVDIVSAMRGRGESEMKIVNDVYQWDIDYHTPRLFNDPTEGFRAANEQDAFNNAWGFVSSVTRSLIKSGVAVMGDTGIVVLVDEDKVERFKPREFPKAQGLVGDIQALTLKYGIRDMPNIALGGAIALMGALCSNRFRFGRTWPNVYIMNLAPTGAGKSFPQQVIKIILAEKLNSPLLGFGDYRSSAAFVKNLVTRRERLDVIDEVSSLFAQMKDGGLYQAEIQQMMCKVWSESNQIFLGSEYAEREDTSTCYNPCISILGSSTIEGIKSKMDKSMMVGGLVPRFMIFSHESYGELKDGELDRDLLEVVAEKCELIANVPRRESDKKVDLRYAPVYDPIDLAPTDRAAVKFLKQLDRSYAKTIETEDESIKHIFTRATEQVRKLALIHCVGCLRSDNQIQMEDLVWARDVFETCLHNSRILFEETNVDGRWETDLAKVLSLFKRKGFVTMRDLSKSIRLEPQRLRQLLDSLVISGEISAAATTHKFNKAEISGWKLE